MANSQLEHYMHINNIQSILNYNKIWTVNLLAFILQSKRTGYAIQRGFD